MKKIVSMLLCLCVLASLIVIPVEAAGYPIIMPDDLQIYVQKGKTANLKFKIIPEFENEKYHINVYKGTTVSPENLVASAENTIFNSSTSIRPLTITWDTTDVESGIYTVEYYMTFYTLYSWHDAPSKYSNMKVRVFKSGEVANKVLNTDIKAYIDGYPIRSYNIDGLTMIVAEDLNKYGFGVTYNHEERTLKIKDKNGEITSTYKHEKNTKPVGSKAMDVYYTDIRTYVKAKDSDSYKSVPGYNVNGLTLIQIDKLSEFGKVKFDNSTRMITFKRS